MKSKIALCIIAALSVANGATLSFSTSTVYSSGYDSLSTPGLTAGQKLLWGVIVDTAGNGVSGNYKPDSVSYLAGSYQLVTATGLPSDDVLVIGTTGNLMSLTTAGNDGTPIGTNRISSIVVNFATVGTAVIGANNPFSIVWFDKLATGGTASGSDAFGLFTIQTALPTTANSLVLPSANSGAPIYAPLFVGNDEIKTQGFAFIPETSTALLGALGALGLLRRRR
jgi:hypothetical protein